MKLSAEGRHFIEKWEEFVPYVYDDKLPKRHIDGRLQYPEWDGVRAVRGTLTVGYGHTNAGGYPYIEKGLRITKERADEILSDDLAPCERAVARNVKVPLTQGQFDALVSFTFNCGEGNLKNLVRFLNKGDYDDIPKRLMMYVTSKGERMRGLVNRRVGEVALWNKNVGEEGEEIFSPKAEKAPPPKTMAASKTGNSAITLGTGGVVGTVVAVNQAAVPIKEAVANAKDLGITEMFWANIHNPLFLISALSIAICAFIWWDRRRKLYEELV